MVVLRELIASDCPVLSIPSRLLEMLSSPETSPYKGLVLFNQAVSLPLESLL